MAATISRRQARSIALAAQHLDRPDGDVETTLGTTGWVRTLGGVDVYLALHARLAGFDAAALDRAAADREAQVLPSARGCIYLVPRAAASDALSLAEHLTAPRAAREHDKAGIEAGELERVGEAVLEALVDGPVSTPGLRRQLPEGTVRSLGDAGKKVGISSTLPPALRQLELERRIVRQVETGRLDTERYLWSLASEPAPREHDVDALCHRLAESFLRAAGLATPRAFAAWSGLKQKQAKSAFSALDAVLCEVEGEKEPHALLAERASWIDEAPDVRGVLALLPFEDNLVSYRGGPAFWVDAEHHEIPVPVWGRGRGTTLGDARQSTLRPVIAEGRMVGFWEFDPDSGSVVTALFATVEAATRAAVEARADDIGALLAGELGHGRSFSLDTDDALRKRVAQLRRLA